MTPWERLDDPTCCDLHRVYKDIEVASKGSLQAVPGSHAICRDSREQQSFCSCIAVFSWQKGVET